MVAPFGDIPPHNKFISVPGVSVCGFTDNERHRVVSERVYFDGATLIKKFKGEIEDDQF